MSPPSAPGRWQARPVITRSAEETEAVARALAIGLREGDVIALSGPLGAGKTRFVAGLAQGVGAPSRVRSPSFTLVNEYAGDRRLVHLDLYRLETTDAPGLGLEELRERGILAVEWGEKLPERVLEDALRLEFELVSEHERRITGWARAAGVPMLEKWKAAIGQGIA